MERGGMELRLRRRVRRRRTEGLGDVYLCISIEEFGRFS
jgi:hypothetical protein